MNKFKEIITTYYLNLIFLVAITGTAISLYFSEFMELAPCDLCWYQRVLFYPILIVSIVALITKDRKVDKYILPMALLGIPIALYHHLLKVTNWFEKDTVFCNEFGACADIDWELWTGSGITIPLLALVGFSTIAIIILLKQRIQK